MHRTGRILLIACCLAAEFGCNGAKSTDPTAAPTTDSTDGSEAISPAEVRNGSAEAETVEAFDEAAESVNLPSDSPDVAPVAASFRPPDLRPTHIEDRAAELGIRLFESRRLRLYTDIDPADAELLPALMDALFEEWVRYFGPLPPARDGSDYQLSGYLMRDQQSFRDAGMLPFNLPSFAHGKHQGQEFWMNDQDHPYYRRHLLLHEATHCFMQSMGGTTDDVPLWYLEGMAELFATHQLDDEGQPTFRVVPEDPGQFIGFGRMEMISEDVRAGRALTLPQLTSLTPAEFQSLQSAYAWSWATCLLADRHPRYTEAFRELGRRYPTQGYDNTRGELIHPLSADFAVEWTLLLRAFDYGHDFRASAISFDPGEPLVDGGTAEVHIAAGRGWQSSGIMLEAGTTHQIHAEGQVTLADEPRPWVSEPDGVTIRYAGGLPIGRLLGIVIGDASAEPAGVRYVGDPISIGRQRDVTPTVSGTLYLRVNEFASEVSDNTGEFEVHIGTASK